MSDDIPNLENSYSYDTPSPDLEKHPHQTNHDHSPQVHTTNEKDNVREKRTQESLMMEYGEKQDRALYQPIWWWFTSTAFPLIAGSFGPIASLFSICALLKTWRLNTLNGSHIPDPPWLITLNSCSLALAIVANLILSFNFARRIQYSLAQPLTISMWYLSSLFLIIPIGLTRLPHLSPSTHPTMTYSQSFYYAVISAIIYFTISTLLLFNIIGASRFFRAYPPTFAVLTLPQRTLMLQTILFASYLALGAGVFSAIEGWTFTDGLYWADYTVLTIGLGSDFPLKTTLGRMLLIPYAPLGIIMVGLLVRSVMELVMERVKEKVVIRRLGKERDRWTDSINKRLQGIDSGKKELTEPRSRSILFCWHHKRHKKFQQLPRIIAHARSAQHQDQQQHHDGKWHQAEFELMRYIEFMSERSERYVALLASILAFLVLWIGGSLVFWVTEHRHQQWTYTESIYFTYTTLLTIGYGDFYPTSPAGKPFFVVWSLIAVPTMTVLIGNMGDTVVRAVQELTDWTGKKTRVLPEYQGEYPRRKREGEVNNDETSSSSGRTRTLASLAPSLSAGRTLAMRNDVERSSISSSEKRHEAPASASSPLEPPFETRDAENLHENSQKPQHSKSSRHHNTKQVQAEIALLAREISKLAKDVGQQPPKKYRWEEWVNWLKILGDEVAPDDVREVELEKKVQVSAMNLPQTDAVTHLDTAQIGQSPHGDHHGHRYHYSQPTAHLNRKDGDGWDWTWLHDKGPLFSPQTETEWILSRLCSKLEHLMNDYCSHA